ncbi:MAG: hypothetical protein JW885_02485 [Deltaproteobacteria bacterium]|nr:hypothetical protein [Candidatus Zymogenaceae bacterium]
MIDREKIIEELSRGTDAEKRDARIAAAYWAGVLEIATPDQFCELLAERPSGEITEVGAEWGGPPLGMDN